MKCSSCRKEMKEPDKLCFEDVKDQIREYLDNIEESPHIMEKLILIDGFVNQPLAKELNKIAIGGTVVPMVMAVGKETKQVYYFAYKGLGIET